MIAHLNMTTTNDGRHSFQCEATRKANLFNVKQIL